MKDDAKVTPPGTIFLPGVSFALTAALLFGASTPLTKVLLDQLDPVLLAGLLYSSAGGALAITWGLRLWFVEKASREASLKKTDLPWLASAISAGGVIAPVLLLVGLRSTPASTTSLLLNLEGVFTTILAWFVFNEHIGRHLVWGMTALTAGSLLLSWSGRPEWSMPWGMLAIVGACLAWAIDNNLTRKVSAGDPLQIAGVKGVVAGTVNLTIALVVGAPAPPVFTAVIAAVVGVLGYGMSLVFFVLALRHLGTARTGAYFSVAPFFGAALSMLILGDHLTAQFLIAAMLMGIGVWLHLTERHEHAHGHDSLEHDHQHRHDAHHSHGHGAESHSHSHVHVGMFHVHRHSPDLHHRHGH